MEGILGSTVPVFLGVSVALMGFAALMTGLALAATWKPAWQAAGYSVLLGFGARFLQFALFEAELLTLSGLLADVTVLVAIALAAHRAGLARGMATQYPWLYERSGIFGWRERSGGD